jgi:hypothetical protein
MANKTADDGQGKRVTTRQRGANTRISPSIMKRKIAKVGDKEFASAGKYTQVNSKGEIVEDSAMNKLRIIQGAARSGTVSTNPNSGWGMYEAAKTAAGLFSDGGLGAADIQDSNNIGYYSYEFPVDALELPASRAEELRFYRLAYDRDPIVGRAIDMHTELPVSKMTAEKPKCSSEEYADYVYDDFQRFMNRTRLFQVIIDAAREYWCIGETFLFIEDPEDIEPCKAAKELLEKDGKGGGGGKAGDGVEPRDSTFHPPEGGTGDRILEYLQPEKRSSWINKRASVFDELKAAGIDFDFGADSIIKDLAKVSAKIEATRKDLNKGARKFAKVVGIAPKKLAKMILASENNEKLSKLIRGEKGDDTYPLQILAEMSKTAQPPAAPAAPSADAPAGDAGAGTPPGADVPAGDPAAGDPAAGGEGAPLGEGGLGDVEGMGGGAPMGGGGGGGGPITPADAAPGVKDAIAMGATISAQRELMEMKHLLKLLEKKKELLEELKEIREKKREELELFGHIENKDYEGPDRIQILPPEQIEITNEGTMVDGPTIYYKPPEAQKQAYMDDPEVPNQVKDVIQTEGKIPLNNDPFQGSYVIHFARKKSGYELHGRSILQRCIRTVIYREKLRQVQSTLASRNMTPKRLIVAPDIPASEVIALRAHIDEAIADPDYSVVVNYECRWDEIGSEGRLLSLDAEWQHTNSDLAIGLGLSPEILIGEGMYSGNHVQLQLMETSYAQFRDLLTHVIEQEIFRPYAMKKGYYEMDKYGRPRWIYPKITFSRMALRDQGDIYDMLFNLYSKGSLPVDIIYEFLDIDPEDAQRELEDNLFTVKDSKFNEMLSNIYNSVGDWLMTNTDLGKRITKGLDLNAVEAEGEDEGPEGSGEGMG